jgi:phosphate transport system permease protein
MLRNRGFQVLCWATAAISVVVLGVLFTAIGIQGVEHLDLDFLRSAPSRTAEKAGLGPAMWGTVWICTICGIVALPLGVGTAIFLEEYKPKHPIASRLHGFVQLNISNLAGVPSIVYGIIGLTVFVQMFGVLGNSSEPSWTIGVRWYDEYVDERGEYLRVRVDDADAPVTELRDGMVMADDYGAVIPITIVDPDTWEMPDEVPAGTMLADAEPDRVDERTWYYLQLPFGRGVLAGGLTLMLVILPIVIISSQEAIRAVPNSLREGSFGLGATKWQVVRRMTLPAAIPGIMTGSILAMSRAIGEAAPILILAGIVYITFKPQHLMDDFTAMPLQIYDWAGRPQKDFHNVAASGIIVLLAILLTFNAVAVFIRQKFQRPLQ